MKMTNAGRRRKALVSNDARVESVVRKMCKILNYEYAKFIV